MDDQTTKELLEIQQQLTSIVTRKHQRVDEEDWERKVKELERRLKDSFKRSQRMSTVYKQLKVEHEQLQNRIEEQEEAERTLRETLQAEVQAKDQAIEEWQMEVNELEEKNDKLLLKLRKLEARELASKRVLPVLKTKLNEALKVITELEK